MRAAEFTIVNESVDWFPKIINAVLAAVPETEEIWFHGSRAIGKERRGSDWDILVVLDPRKVNSFIDVQFALQRLKFKNFDIQAASPTGIITKIARDEGKLLWSNTQQSQAKLTKFYRGHGFTPAIKGSKHMAWTPKLNSGLGPNVSQ